MKNGDRRDRHLQCARNRRTAMSRTQKVRGVGWDVSAIGNAVCGGAKLADVLELVGIPKLTSSTLSGGKHVEFVSIDKCKEENGGPYKASIPLSQATNPEADVLLAYEMNGEPLNRDHGYQLRVILPGVIGARSVKWLDSINIIAEECQGFFMQKDYKMFPPSVDWDNIDWSTRRPQMDFPIQITISGYAASEGAEESRERLSIDVAKPGGFGCKCPTRKRAGYLEPKSAVLMDSSYVILECDFTLWDRCESLPPEIFNVGGLMLFGSSQPVLPRNKTFNAASEISVKRDAALFLVWKVKKWVGAGSQKQLKDTVEDVIAHVEGIIHDKKRD
ncbi:Sulfite oxidase [Hibiscus syriacus]|uniref:Sulfite oxidase n=1 Tax=Hibiscus syriacus TaxID=106335 RepID=A0A6A3BMG9_HIBSY|nr:Sulfite oxidase [Hibiscus syriacus]